MSLFRLFKTAPKPIGIVRWNNGKTVAELWGRNEWKAKVDGREDRTLARNLKAMYETSVQHGGPSYGKYGPAILADLADMMGGTYRFHDPGRLPKGVAS